jgi:g-D-glutamyl-meso-diaminopimelate peptidase
MTASPSLTPKATAEATRYLTPEATKSAAPSATPTPMRTKAAGPIPIEVKSCKVQCEEYLTLRGAPSPDARSLGRVKKGATVRVDAYAGAFAHVTDSGGRSGYVLAGYLVPAKTDPYLSGLTIVKPVEEYSYGQMMADLQDLAARYPGRLRIGSIGKTLQGRDIPVAVLGDPDAPRQVLVQGGIHAREHMTGLLMTAQLEYCLKYGDAPFGSGTLDEALDGVCLHILPMANPDGVVISQAAAMPDALKPIYRYDLLHGSAGMKPAEYLRTWKANAAGVDINRNFPAGWADIDSQSGPSSSRYKGAQPADQPETRALMDYTRMHDFDATVSYHAWGSCVYWQYGTDATVNDRSHSLALAVEAHTQYTPEGFGELDAGGYKDWAMEAMGIPSVTIEIGTRECPLPLDEFYTIWERNKNVYAVVAEWAKDQ